MYAAIHVETLMVSSWHNCFDDMLIVVINGKYKLVFDDSFGFTDHVTQQIRMLLLGSTPFILNTDGMFKILY